MTKICAFCEAPFQPSSTTPHRQRFCSRDCQVRAWRDTVWQRQRQAKLDAWKKTIRR